MNKRLLTCIWFVVCAMITVQSANAVNVIPQPVKMTENGQKFALNSDTKILFSAGLKEQALLLQSALSPATGWDLEIAESNKAKSNAIYLGIDKTIDLKPEGYKLSVTNKSILITAREDVGVFYGIQTLLQLMPVEIYNKQRQKELVWNVPGVDIEDEPTFAWRGMMLDVSRYFFEMDYVIRFIDMMAMYKLNVLHMHLIDDAGWRLEIKKYPKLTSVGAWRGEGKDRTGGYYTQEDIKKMVAYAAERNVEVIPEIEIPAHTLAAIAAYPHLSCTEKNFKVPLQHFISRDLYCVGKESTFEFLEDVFEEAFALFSSKYIHIGGDEARYDRWKVCPHCQKRKKELGLGSEKELQVYFNQRIQKMVKKHGKTIVGWDEIIEDGLTQKAVGMVWHDKKKAYSGVKAGHDIVMALTSSCYFDVAESKIPGEVKAATWLPPISLKNTYSWDPMIDGIDEKYRSQILGAHGCLWSDQFIHGTILQRIEPINENRAEKYFDYLTFPRMSALAEVCWTPKAQRDWAIFETNMQTHYNRYDQAGYGYRLPQPKLVSKKKKGEGYEIVLENVVEAAEIRYTVDGIRPNVHSTVYTKPVLVKRLADFQAITVVNRHQYSLPLYFPQKYEAFKKYGKLVAEWRPKDISGKKYNEFEMNATGKIDKNGKYELTFLYTGGNSRLDIKSVEVYKNGKKVTEDIHEGYTGGASKNNIYKFIIGDYETGAAYKIKAQVRGDLGNDSYGVVFIKN
ncbi:beta-N-acetylhexosaminidase [Saccharicrinis sp. GN24d3]|uniref:beta-N-acetylhexosaminidase n=1 Tax=Saccharicrinis sp. GN24d3 TaxID=3458416 RepID=UPI004035F434